MVGCLECMCIGLSTAVNTSHHCCYQWARCWSSTSTITVIPIVCLPPLPIAPATLNTTASTIYHCPLLPPEPPPPPLLYTTIVTVTTVMLPFSLSLLQLQPLLQLHHHHFCFHANAATTTTSYTVSITIPLIPSSPLLQCCHYHDYQDSYSQFCHHHFFRYLSKP